MLDMRLWPIWLEYAVLGMMVISLILSLNYFYRRLILSLYQQFRYEPYIYQQAAFRRSVPPFLLVLVFCLGGVWVIGQWYWCFSEQSSPLVLVPLLMALAIGLLIAVIDYKLQLIPLVLLRLFGLVIMSAIYFSAEHDWLESLWRCLLVYSGLRLLVWGLSYRTGQQGLGLADIYLFSILALWFDLYSSLQLITLACLLGLVYIFMHNRLNPHKSPLTTIAFGPWIICASGLILQISFWTT